MTTCETHKAEASSCANTDVKSKLTEMLGMLQKGQMTEGQEKYFADDVVTQEGNDAAVAGKQAAIERLNKFREALGITGFVSYAIGSMAVAGNVSFYDAVLSVKVKSGDTIHLEQVVRTEWKNGKIVHERYFHG
jgi:hypothetical protein